MLLLFEVQSFHSPCGRAGNFLDSGHPALRRFAASSAVRAAPAAQCLCKESHQRNTPPVARSPAIRQLLLHCSNSGIPAVAMASDCASGGRVPLTGHPWPAAESARSLAPTLRASSSAARRATGGPLGRHPAAEATATARAYLALERKVSLTQCRDARIRGSTRRSRCRASQATAKWARRGARTMRARRLQYMDVLSANPAGAEKHRGV